MPGPQRLDSTPHFERLQAWQACHQLALAVYRATDAWPRDARVLSAQVQRAALSSVAHIAEGAARRRSPDFRRLLERSIGSQAELKTLLLLARDRGYLDRAGSNELEILRDHASRLLWGLYRSVSRRAARSAT